MKRNLCSEIITLPPQSINSVIASRKIPTLEIIAYTGGFMNVPGWGPLCIDLNGLEAGQVAVLTDHDANRSGVVGHGLATIEDGKLVVRGQISADGDAARQVVSAAKNGFPWQASVGLQVLQSKRLGAGQTIQLNGRHLTVPDGGAILVIRGKLREVSITALGCDADTCVNIAAMKRQGENSMEPSVEVKEVVENEANQREANRIVNITTICGGRFDEIRAKAIDEGWDEIQTELEVLRASRPKAPNVYRPISTPNTVFCRTLRIDFGGNGQWRLKNESRRSAMHGGVPTCRSGPSPTRRRMSRNGPTRMATVSCGGTLTMPSAAPALRAGWPLTS